MSKVVTTRLPDMNLQQEYLIGIYDSWPNNYEILSIPGYTQKHGHRYTKCNQDAYIHYMLEPDLRVFGVLDGHGERGQQISNWAKSRLIVYLKFLDCKDPKVHKMQPALAALQQELQTKEDAKASGTTFCGGILDSKTKTLHLANVGDSTCCLFRKSENRLEYKVVNRLHTPSDPDEVKRIEKKGGKIVDGYIDYEDGHLNLTRSLGDYNGTKSGISDQPEFFVQDLKNWDYLVCGSDGLFDYLDKEEMAKIILTRPEPDTAVINQLLINRAQKAWIEQNGGRYIDDITSVLIHLSF